MGYNIVEHMRRCCDVREAERMQNHNVKRAVVFGVLAAAWLCVLFFFSGQSGEESGDLSGRLTRFLFGRWIERGADEARLDHILRKCAHAGIFAVEGFLLGISLLSGLKRRAEACYLTLAGCAVIAVANELHQLTSPERSCDVRDMVIDTAGAAAGLIAAMVLLHLFRIRRQKRLQYDKGDAI